MFKVGELGRKRAKTKELPDLNYLKSLIQYCPNTGNIWWLDSKEVRMALMQRVHGGEITLQQAQDELARIKRGAKKAGKMTRAQTFSRG